jgi:hypothetical protein
MRLENAICERYIVLVFGFTIVHTSFNVINKAMGRK